MKTKEVIDWLDATFHPEYQEDYDNAGFLLGDSASDYRGALVALDLTPAGGLFDNPFVAFAEYCASKN